MCNNTLLYWRKYSWYLLFRRVTSKGYQEWAVEKSLFLLMQQTALYIFLSFTFYPCLTLVLSAETVLLCKHDYAQYKSHILWYYLHTPLNPLWQDMFSQTAVSGVCVANTSLFLVVLVFHDHVTLKMITWISLYTIVDAYKWQIKSRGLRMPRSV